MNLLVIGASGLVGSNIVAQADDMTTTGTYLSVESDHADRHLDKTDAEATRDLVRDVNPDVIVDTAAFHDVDACEHNHEQAFEVNTVGTRHMAQAANEVGAQLIYLSTDYVFAGDPDEAPYIETDPIAPLNYYARTKYAGECAAAIADRSTVLRSSVIYGLARENFVTWVLGELRAGNQVGIVDDQTAAPTYAPDLASGCLDVARGTITGLYHVSGPVSLSRYEFTVRLARAYGFDTGLVDPITTQELGQVAPRPTDSTLDSIRFYETIDTEFRGPERAFEDMRRREE